MKDKLSKWMSDKDYDEAIILLEETLKEEEKRKKKRPVDAQEIIDLTWQQLREAVKVRNSFFHKYEHHRHDKKVRHELLEDWLNYTRLLHNSAEVVRYGTDTRNNDEDSIRLREISKRLIKKD